MRNTTTTVAIAAGLVLAASTGLLSDGASAAQIIVPTDFPTIQGAILAAIEGDEVLVLPGTYFEDVFFNGHNITVRGVAGPDATTISGSGAFHGTVRAVLGEDLNTLFEGFTVTGGSTGFRCEGSHPRINNCVFTGNSPGVQVSSDSRPWITRCEFRLNSGSGISVGNGPNTVRVEWCVFDSNGTGMSLFGQPAGQITPVISNCLFINNGSGNGLGGAVFNLNLPAPIFANCTFYGNSASLGGAIYNSSLVTIVNCIAWNNSPTSLSGSVSGTSVSYSDIEEGWPGSVASIIADPMFVNPAGGDYRLQMGSPCIDLGFNSATLGVLDLDGNLRRVDILNVPDCPQPDGNCGLAPIVDMGPYELQPPPCLDITGDNLVGIVDFLLLLAAWGPNPGHPADFDGDGVVGIVDFLLLLASWGPCS